MIDATQALPLVWGRFFRETGGYTKMTEGIRQVQDTDPSVRVLSTFGEGVAKWKKGYDKPSSCDCEKLPCAPTENRNTGPLQTAT